VAGNGGAVKVAKSGGAITTKGDFAPGIQAQSIGGGGGNGSWSVAGTVGNLNPKSSDRTNISVSGSVGGFGGAGGKGGAVTVGNKTDSSKNVEAADIFTQGTSSYGIFAQSIGGGGGNGGMSFDAALSSEAGKGGQTKWYGGVDLQVGASVGGFGGKGNDGGTANVDNDGNITTAGYKAHGIFAQSVGGGGGVGGDSAIFNYTLPSKGTPEIPDVGWNLSLEANVGGTGGAAGQGSKVTVKNTGKIVTQGDDACGIFAQSVGGGGGTGGNCISFPYLPLPSGKTLQSLFTSFFNVLKPSVFVGGAGGASGKGGDVTVDNRGDITTMGGVLATDKNDHSVIGAHGIFAQSVGGGGGTGGNANIGYKFGRIGFGGEGGSSGAGGQVTVTNSGNISTQGQGGCGIYAQSVGGGGGIAGNIVRSFFNFSGDKVPFLTYFGLGTGIGLAGGAGGNGGQVTVTSTGNIATLGDGAFGIFAQSVGGGGGTGGIDTAYASVGPGKLLFNGSTFHGADGNGGPVSISQTGTITTEGDYAHGIVAQSTSGKGKAGKVDVTLNGKIIANGIGSHGIQAQSLGAGSSNPINVTIKEGSTVQGGSDTASVAPSIYSYGVLFMDGSANTLAGGGGNTLNNYGFIHTLSGIDGTAVMQQANFGAPNWGDLTINNSGTITGSINQCTQVLTDDSKQLAEGMSLPTGFSTITFNNNQGAVFNTGSIINLGSGTLTNGGTLNLRGGGAGQSNLTGNFIQTSSGIFQTILNGDGTCGSLKVSGTATLAGTLKGLLGSGVFTNGTQYTVLQASNPITTKFTKEDLPHTSLVSFSTVYLNKALEVVSNVQSFTTVARNPHHWQLGQYLDTLLSAPARLTGEFSGALGEFQTTDESNYPKIFESLSPGVYDADTITTFSITRQYVRTLQQRLQVVRENLRSPEMESRAQASQPVLLAYNGSNQQLGQLLAPRQEADLYRRLGVWLQGFGQWGSQDAVDGFSSFSYNLAGTAAGLDYALTKRLVLGANFGYGYTKINQDNNFASGHFDSLYGSLYGAYFGERAYLEGVLSYGHHKYRNNRLISIGPLQRVAESNHTGNSFFLFMEGGYSWPVQNWTLQPFGSLFYTYLDEGGFQESGAAGLDMQVDARQTNSVVSEMGLRLARVIKTSKGILIPEVKAAWQHDFAVSARTLPISFAGAPLGLAIDGRDLSQDGAVVSAGLSFTSKGGVTTSIKYDAELRGGYQAQAVIGQIRLSF
jgi:outer membrane autotransporter protein